LTAYKKDVSFSFITRKHIVLDKSWNLSIVRQKLRTSLYKAAGMVATCCWFGIYALSHACL